MKTKYLIAMAAAVGTAWYYLKFRKGANSANLSMHRVKKVSVNGENHIRKIMKKSKLAL